MMDIQKIDEKKGNRVVFDVKSSWKMHDLVSDLIQRVGNDNIHVDFTGSGYISGKMTDVSTVSVSSYNLQHTYLRTSEGATISDFRGTFDVFWKEGK